MRRMACGCIVLGLTLLLLAGCIVSKTRQASPVAQVRLGAFKVVEMKPVSLGAAFAVAKANQRALKKIDGALTRGMQTVFPDLILLDPTEDFSKTRVRTLQITPVVTELRLSGGKSAPLEGNGMVEGSDATLQVTFRDSSNGKVIAAPEFYRSADAAEEGGAGDRMLEDLASDVAQYCSNNW